MTQGILPFKYKSEERPSGMTALAGLPLYFDLMDLIKSEPIISHSSSRKVQEPGLVAQSMCQLIDPP